MPGPASASSSGPESGPGYGYGYGGRGRKVVTFEDDDDDRRDRFQFLEDKHPLCSRPAGGVVGMGVRIWIDDPRGVDRGLGILYDDRD